MELDIHSFSWGDTGAVSISVDAYLNSKLKKLPIPFKLKYFSGCAIPLRVFRTISTLEDLTPDLFREGLDELSTNLINLVKLELLVKQYKEIHIRCSGFTFITLSKNTLEFSLNYIFI